MEGTWHRGPMIIGFWTMLRAARIGHGGPGPTSQDPSRPAPELGLPDCDSTRLPILRSTTPRSSALRLPSAKYADMMVQVVFRNTR